MQVWEQDVDECLTRYHDLLEKLEPYPEWRDKVVDDIGKWFHMIHNNLAEGSAKANVFLKLVMSYLPRTDRIILYDA